MSTKGPTKRQLFLAAPDLLTACIAIAEWIDDEHPIWDIPEDLPIIRLRQRLYNAITKAGAVDPQDETGQGVIAECH